VLLENSGQLHRMHDSGCWLSVGSLSRKGTGHRLACRSRIAIGVVWLGLSRSGLHLMNDTLITFRPSVREIHGCRTT
jgi:hypothetical protein